MELFDEISAVLQKGQLSQVTELVQNALDAGQSAQDILDNGLLAGMSIIGDKFKRNEVFVPEVLIAARAMNAGVDILKPHLAEGNTEKKGTVVLGTVKGDLHDIGKNLVKIMMEGHGLEVIDLGTNVAAEVFVDKAVETGANVIACSALLTTTMAEMEQVVKAVAAKGIQSDVKVMIGGAPLTEEFCKSIGADVYSADAASAAEMAVQLCSR